MDKQQRREAAAAYKARLQQGGVFQIRNTGNGRILLRRTTDLRGSRNRFQFAQMTGSCTDYALQAEWGPGRKRVCILEVLEELEQKETQTEAEFKAAVEACYEHWQEKAGGYAAILIPWRFGSKKCSPRELFCFLPSQHGQYLFTEEIAERDERGIPDRDPQRRPADKPTHRHPDQPCGDGNDCAQHRDDAAERQPATMLCVNVLMAPLDKERNFSLLPKTLLHDRLAAPVTDRVDHQAAGPHRTPR